MKRRSKGSAGKILNIPPSLESSIYREIHTELAQLSDEELISYYQHTGKSKGHRTHRLIDRLAFVNLIPSSIHTLEIGPYGRPLKSGPNVKYVDVYSTKELKKRAPAEGMEPEQVPQIHWADFEYFETWWPILRLSSRLSFLL